MEKKKYKYLSYVFSGIAIILSNIMSATVAYNYCNMVWGVKYAMYSASEKVAFLLMIPYAIGIIICVVLAFIFNKKYNDHQKKLKRLMRPR